MGNIDVILIYRYPCEENIDTISILIIANITIPRLYLWIIAVYGRNNVRLPIFVRYLPFSSSLCNYLSNFHKYSRKFYKFGEFSISIHCQLP